MLLLRELLFRTIHLSLSVVNWTESRLLAKNHRDKYTLVHLCVQKNLPLQHVGINFKERIKDVV